MKVPDIMAKLHHAFNAEEAQGLDACFQFMLTGDDDFYITITDAQCDSAIGEHDDPDITLTMGADTFEQMISGELDGMQAYMSGQLKASGNIMLATRLGKLFTLRS